jgi:hypothetical protein
MRYLLALLIFVAINAALSSTVPLAKVDPESLPAAHTWVWWATTEYLASKPPPDVVLLGSSLVMHSVSRCEADYLGRDLDYVTHHKSLYLRNRLITNLHGYNGECFNFALPGGMVSDDFIIGRAMFKPDRKPKVLVLGLSLRDFMDTCVHCAGSTPAFRYLKRYCSIDDVVGLALPDLYRQQEYWLGKGLYLYGNSLDLQVITAEQTKSLFNHLAPPPAIAAACHPDYTPINARSEVEKGLFIVPSNPRYEFEDNRPIFRKRYRHRNEQLFAIQKTFFEKLLKQCKDLGIRVIIANMPLTEDHLRILPPGQYEEYLSMLVAESNKYGCAYIDLNSDPQFSRQDYYDTCHMNGKGGRKFLDVLVRTITSDPSLAKHLTKPASELASKLPSPPL